MIRWIGMTALTTAVAVLLVVGTIVADDGTMDIEPKLPLSPEEELRLVRDDGGIEISGETFTYFIDNRSGLISGIRVLDEDYLKPDDQYLFPDTWLSPERNPAEGTWRAAHETAATVEVLKNSPEEVVVRAAGAYRNRDGEAFPISYRITYQVFIDGVTFIHVLCRAEAEAHLRYLALNRGSIPAGICRYFSHLPDIAFSRGIGNYQFEELPADDGSLLEGVFLPWFWIGSPRTGVEITTWDVSEQHYRPVEYRYPAGHGFGDFLGSDRNMFSVDKKEGRITWNQFSLRNAMTPVKPGWEIDGRFALAVTPPKAFKSKYLELRPAPQLGWGDRESIEAAGRRGANYMEGGMGTLNRSEDLPYRQPDLDNEAIKNSYDLYDKQGIRAIPYYSLTDFDERNPKFLANGLDWVLEPGYGFQFRTSGICPAVPEWREYWKSRLDSFFEAYPVDGIYHDMWYAMLDCENDRHGCGTRFRRVTFPWARDMLAHSYNSLHKKDPGGLMFHNLNVCPVAMLTSFADVRLVGEARDIAELDPVSRYGLYFSYRLGNQTSWSTYRSNFTQDQQITFGLLIGSLLPRHPRDLYSPRTRVGAKATTAEDINKRWLYWNIFRFFKAAQSTWHPALSGQDLVRTSDDQVYVNVYHKEGGGELLLTVANLNDRSLETTLEIPKLDGLGLEAATGFCVYDPVNRSILGGKPVKGGELSGMKVELAEYGHAVLYITPASEKSRRLLFGLGLDGINGLKQTRKMTSFQIDAPDGAEVELVFLSPGSRPGSIERNGRQIDFQWKQPDGLAVVNLAAGASDEIEINW